MTLEHLEALEQALLDAHEEIVRMLKSGSVRLEVIGATAELAQLRERVALLVGYLDACDAIGYVERATNPANAENLRQLVEACR